MAPVAAQTLENRCEFVSTPQHGSWLHVAEVEINGLMRQGLPRRSASLEVLRAEVAAWQAPETASGTRSTGSSPRTTPR